MRRREQDYQALIEILLKGGVRYWLCDHEDGPLVFEEVTEHLRIRWIYHPDDHQYDGFAIDARRVNRVDEDCLLAFMQTDSAEWCVLSPEIVIPADGGWHFAGISRRKYGNGRHETDSLSGFHAAFRDEASRVGDWVTAALAGRM